VVAVIVVVVAAVTVVVEAVAVAASSSKVVVVAVLVVVPDIVVWLVWLDIVCVTVIARPVDDMNDDRVYQCYSRCLHLACSVLQQFVQDRS